MENILFVSHKKAQCGVYEYGINVTDVLKSSKQYKFIRTECSAIEDVHAAVAAYSPAAIIYNYYESVMPWMVTKIAPNVFRNNAAGIRVPQIGIIHEITQSIANRAVNYKNTYLRGGAAFHNLLFDFYIAPDPTLLLLNPFVYKTGRLIPSYRNRFPEPKTPVIGSFGFGTPKKGFQKIVQMVQQEFDTAEIRMNIPSADFGDKDGSNARAIAAACTAIISKPGITLSITHDYLDHSANLDFLAKNSMNVFLYEDKTGRGLSSALDIAMAVQRPIAVSDAVMFRHVFDVEPSICVSKNSLRTILRNGFMPLEKHFKEWTPENLLWEYERIVGSVIRRQQHNAEHKKGLKNKIHSLFNRINNVPDQSFSWLRNAEKATDDDLTVDRSVRYVPVALPAGAALNRILDNEARALYAPAIETLKTLVPVTMAKKIPEANVQQAFVFDTVHRFLQQSDRLKILCVGSYEDTAAMGLMKMGMAIEEIDPTLNYSLQEFFLKPSTVKNSYDIIFSTSVIEHVPDDDVFVQNIADLLAPGGIAVITCDYKDGWKSGEPKPDVDVRFYTQRDLKDRLLSLMKNCVLVDEPQWDCLEPDFHYLGTYRYTFATFVVKKLER